MKTTLCICILSCVIFISGCDRLTEPTQYEHTYVYRIDYRDYTYGGADFSEIGGLVNTLSDGETIAFNGDVFLGAYSSLNENYYAVEYPEKIEVMEFTFTDSEGTEFKNTFEIEYLPSVSLDNSAPVLKNEDWHIQWIGEPLRENEVMRLRVIDESGFDEIAIEELTEVGATEFVVPESQLFEVQTWEVIKASIRREITEPLNRVEGTGTMSRDTEYYEFEVD
ncbi:MAG: hypothetical protein H7Y00_03540 [Fimbriimonadaceae bacterium]|nr:hypothetical protein [Chitinophagales bacterium]